MVDIQTFDALKYQQLVHHDHNVLVMSISWDFIPKYFIFYVREIVFLEYKLLNLVPNIEFELPLQWETDQIPPFVCLVRKIFIYIGAEIFLL